ncbi:MAG: 16S rRNA (cytosine(1402)-N(4))-methyltransferase [Anaerolineaceae bacterium 4572_78]|nr:MAG: 16S rRNA (cytosine(1402)-N(4))-methyltransferase [Anaerolineaceae bacterium 4572_78]
MSVLHHPVLLNEVLHALNLKAGQTVIDCTIGAGGHAEHILKVISPSSPLKGNGWGGVMSPAGKLLGLDTDDNALEITTQCLKPYGSHVCLRHANFAQLERIAVEENFTSAHAILADLGVSSMQLDNAERGFSFQIDGTLDMRMNPSQGQSATKLVNTISEKALADIIYHYGEERKSRQIAKAIVKARPIYTTLELADVVSRIVGKHHRQRIHPATRTFMAIRIAVNDELTNLEKFLPQAINLLAPLGRLAIITFHSLEDRPVKHFFQQEAKACICPPRLPICACNHQATIRIITRKPITATEQEIMNNPRARSAKLRVVERKGVQKV